MELREKKAILSLMDYLCLNTTATDQILIRLIGSGVLTLPEYEETKATPSSHEQNSKMYSHIVKKKSTMGILLKALRETCNNHIADSIEKQMESESANPESPSTAIQNEGIDLEMIIRPMMNQMCKNTNNPKNLALILLSKGLLTLEEYEENKKISRNKELFHLIYTVWKKNHLAVGELSKILIQSGNGHIADQIEQEWNLQKELSDAQKDFSSSHEPIINQFRRNSQVKL